jgi:central kinetochore subunit Mal2/MCM21
LPPRVHLTVLTSHICSIITVKNFQNRRHLLSSSLLSSDYIRQQIQAVGPSSSTTGSGEDISPLVASAGKHRDSNHHRVAFSTTTFPFKDPSPHSESPNLLGVRIDVCGRAGKFAKPYYVLLKREKGERVDAKRLTVYRHTIPAFIPIEKLAQRYLPRSSSRQDGDGGDGGDDEIRKPQRTKKQDLGAFVRQLRRELVAWHLRRDSIAWLRERLGISGDDDEDDDNRRIASPTVGPAQIVSLTPTSIEARYARLEWQDGRVGRFKISNSGLVQRAVVIGGQGRDKSIEDAMSGGDRRVENILDRLKGTLVT